MTIVVLLIIRVRIPSTLAWSLDERPCHHVVQLLHWLLDGVEVQKNGNTVKIGLISFQWVNRTIVVLLSYNMKSNFTFVSGLTLAWSLEIGWWSHHVAQPLSCLRCGLEVQKNQNPVKIWIILVGEYRSITYDMKLNYTFVSGFHQL